FAMGRAVERIVPHLVMSLIAGFQVLGILLALYTSGWWLLPSLALAVAAIYGQVTVNDFVLARYAPPAWRGRIYAIRFFLIFTMAGPAAWGIGRLYEQGGFNTVLGVGAAIALLGAIRAAHARTQAPARHTARHKAAARKAEAPPVDTRPRYKRDDTPAAAPVAATPATPATAAKRRHARKPAGTAQPGAAAP